METPGIDDVARGLGRHMRVMLDALRERARTTDELIDLLYGDDPDAMPEWPIACMRVAMTRLRRRLAPAGWTVKTTVVPASYRTREARSGVIGLYRLVRLGDL